MKNILPIACLLLLANGPVNAQETTMSRIGKLTFDHGLPTEKTRQTLYDANDFQRAVQAVQWIEPAMQNSLVADAMRKLGVKNLGALLYNERMHPGQDVTTPNQSVVYLFDYINLKDTGPIVHEVPAGPINAGFYDMWMRPVYDFGITGPNQGKGDKILVLPPDYEGDVPGGFEQVARARNYQNFTITRIAVKPGMTQEQATANLKKLKTYRLADADNPPAKQFIMMGDPQKGGNEFRTPRLTGLDYWERVHEIINSEPVEDRDRIMLGTLEGIGIERGEPFEPDARLTRILTEAEEVGLAMMINEAFSPRFAPKGVNQELYPGTHWENLQLLPDMTQEGPNGTYVINRMVAFYQACGAQYAWNPRDFPPGFGQKYAGCYKDSDGDWLKGGNTYRLRVPANVPVADFWSVAIYDVESRALVETEQHKGEFNPKVQQLKTNDDGSVDLYLAPKAPKGMESNWIQTVPGRAWFAYFRWYGPTEAYYDKSWRLTDFERIK